MITSSQHQHIRWEDTSKENWTLQGDYAESKCTCGEVLRMPWPFKGKYYEKTKLASSSK